MAEQVEMEFAVALDCFACCRSIVERWTMPDVTFDGNNSGLVLSTLASFSLPCFRPSSTFPEEWESHPALTFRSKVNWLKRNRWEVVYRREYHRQQELDLRYTQAVLRLQNAVRSWGQRQRSQLGKRAVKDIPSRSMTSARRPVDPEEFIVRQERMRVLLEGNASKGHQMLPALRRIAAARHQASLKPSQLQPTPRPSAFGWAKNCRNQKWHEDLLLYNHCFHQQRANTVARKKKQELKEEDSQLTGDWTNAPSLVDIPSPHAPSGAKTLKSRPRQVRAVTGQSLPCKEAEEALIMFSESVPQRSRFSSFSATTAKPALAFTEEDLARIVRQAASKDPNHPSCAGIQLSPEDVLGSSRSSRRGSVNGHIYHRRELQPLSGSGGTTLMHAGIPQLEKQAHFHKLRGRVEGLIAQVQASLLQTKDTTNRNEPYSSRPVSRASRCASRAGSITGHCSTQMPVPTNRQEAWDRIIALRSEVSALMAQELAAGGKTPAQQLQHLEDRKELNLLSDQLLALLRTVEAGWHGDHLVDTRHEEQKKFPSLAPPNPAAVCMQEPSPTTKSFQTAQAFERNVAQVHQGALTCLCTRRPTASAAPLCYPLDPTTVHMEGICVWECCGLNWNTTHCPGATVRRPSVIQKHRQLKVYQPGGSPDPNFLTSADGQECAHQQQAMALASQLDKGTPKKDTSEGHTLNFPKQTSQLGTERKSQVVKGLTRCGHKFSSCRNKTLFPQEQENGAPSNKGQSSEQNGSNNFSHFMIAPFVEKKNVSGSIAKR